MVSLWSCLCLRQKHEAPTSAVKFDASPEEAELSHRPCTHRNGATAHISQLEAQSQCGKKPAYEKLAAPESAPHQDSSMAGNNEERPIQASLIEAAPFSMAVVSSDATNVLYHRLGLEPASGQLLEQVLCTMLITLITLIKIRHPSMSQLRHDRDPGKELPKSSFLAALVGPQEEAAVLKSVHDVRYWKGSVSTHVTTKGPESDTSSSQPGSVPELAQSSVFQHISMSQSSTLSPASVGKQWQRSPLIMSEAALQEFESECGSNESNVRTRALLRALSQAQYLDHDQVEDLVLDAPSRTSTNLHKPLVSLPGKLTKKMPVGLLMNQPACQGTNNGCEYLEDTCKEQTCCSASSYHQVGKDGANTCQASTSRIEDLSCRRGTCMSGARTKSQFTHGRCFDVTVSMMNPPDEKESWLLVIISDSQQPSQVQATLSVLAQAQLQLLCSMMPQHAVQFLINHKKEAAPKELARAHEGVTIMFLDICDFTAMCKDVSPKEVMVFLNTLFSIFDQLTDEYHVHKVETAGDCYVVSGGVLQRDANGFGHVVKEQDPAKSAKQVFEFAKALLEKAKQVNMPDTRKPVLVRIGIHTGDVVSGLIGCKVPKFSLVGDAMNTASIMESMGTPGRIHVSNSTFKLLAHERWEPTMGMEVEGKGLMHTYLWAPQPTKTLNQPLLPLLPDDPPQMLPTLVFQKTRHLLQQLNAEAPVGVLDAHTPGSQALEE